MLFRSYHEEGIAVVVVMVVGVHSSAGEGNPEEGDNQHGDSGLLVVYTQRLADTAPDHEADKGLVLAGDKEVDLVVGMVFGLVEDMLQIFHDQDMEAGLLMKSQLIG